MERQRRQLRRIRPEVDRDRSADLAPDRGRASFHQRYVKRGGKMWIRVFPDKPITKKPIEVRMGSGKGNVEFWVAQIQPGPDDLRDRRRRRSHGARGVPPGRRQALGHHHIRCADGALMELKQLKQKSADELKTHLVDLHKEQFSLRMQKATGQLAKPTKPAGCVARSHASTPARPDPDG
jgi:hypothetical protein